ncbi:MAG: lipid II flippase MurJ [Actinomycetaceae bacterium]|nr:lipid II flippase MurJ [Actinomycetaceae bacterium]
MGGSGKRGRLYSAATGAVGVIAIATLTSRAVGFLRWLAQSALVGSGSTAGAYASANQIPNIIFEIVVGGALAGITVPLLSASLAKGRGEHAHKVASALLTWVTLILLAVAVFVFALAPFIAGTLPVPADADVEAQRALITRFLRIFAWQIPLYGVSIVLTGVLQAHKKFFWAAIAPAMSSIVVIATFAGYAWLNPNRDGTPPTAAVDALGWGTTAGVAVLALPLFIPAYRVGFKYRPTLKLQADERRRAVALGASGLGALIAQQFSVVVSLWLMRSHGASGTVAVFQYVQAVYWLPYAVAVYPVATAAFPLLSEHGQGGCSPRFKITCSHAMRKVVVAGLLGTSLLVIMAPVAQAFFNLLTPVPGMASALIVIAPALIGYSVLFYGQRVLYALSESRSAWQVAALGWVSVALSQIVFVRLFVDSGGDGPGTLRAIAAGHTVGMTVSAVAVIVVIARITDGFEMNELRALTFRSLRPLIVATILGGSATMYLTTLGTGGWRLLAIIGAGIAGVLILAASIALLGKDSVVKALTTSLVSNNHQGEKNDL